MTTPALRLSPDTTDAEVGSRVCLALVNTVYWRRGDAPIEGLTSYDSLLAAVAGALATGSASALRVAATAHPRKAAQALGEAVELREALHHVFAAIAAGAAVPAHDRATVERWFRTAAAHLALDPTELRLDPADDLALPVWHAAISAGALLTSGPLHRVKACPGPTCGWLFVDVTRNGSRRWCDPAQCGNRERVRAHYRRTHGRQ